jgi:hypothetical protein
MPRCWCLILPQIQVSESVVLGKDICKQKMITSFRLYIPGALHDAIMMFVDRGRVMEHIPCIASLISIQQVRNYTFAYLPSI